MYRTVLAACATAIILAVFVSSSPAQAQRRSVPLVGQPAPEFELTDVNGRTVTLSQFKGRKHVLTVVQRGWVGYW